MIFIRVILFIGIFLTVATLLQANRGAPVSKAKPVPKKKPTKIVYPEITVYCQGYDIQQFKGRITRGDGFHRVQNFDLDLVYYIPTNCLVIQDNKQK